MTTYRMLPATDLKYQTLTINGRQYTGTPGSAVDVPDFDADGLGSNGWVKVAPSGPTSARPVGSAGFYQALAGKHYYDMTLNALIVFDGTTWRSPVDGSAV